MHEHARHSMLGALKASAVIGSDAPFSSTSGTMVAAAAALAPPCPLLSSREAIGRPTLRAQALPSLSSRARGSCVRVAAQKVGRSSGRPPSAARGCERAEVPAGSHRRPLLTGRAPPLLPSPGQR